MQSNTIFGFLLASFVIYITVRGEFSKYSGFFLGSAVATAPAPPASTPTPTPTPTKSNASSLVGDAEKLAPLALMFL